MLHIILFKLSFFKFRIVISILFYNLITTRKVNMYLLQPKVLKMGYE